MKKLLLFLLFVFLKFGLEAQTTISGFVTDSLGAPLPFAHVYLEETTVGVMANSAGVYRLEIPQNGNYQLVVSCVGYKTYSQIIRANGGNLKFDISLHPKIIVLNEVEVSAKNRHRWKYYPDFLNNFIGNSLNAQYCYLKNRKDLILYTNSSDSILTAFSVKPLVIKNTALGYKLFYDLKDFHLNLKTGHVQFSGRLYFQELEGGKARTAHWQKERLRVYYGSKMQFLRALFSHTCQKEKFAMYEYVKDTTATGWTPGVAVDENDLYKGFDKGTVTLYYPNPILIDYTYIHTPELYPGVHKDIPKLESRMIFSDSLKVYKNGYFGNTYGVMWGGEMGGSRVAEMLPYDFLPVLPEKKSKKK